MTRFAQLSDVHLNGTPERHHRFLRALDQAQQSNCDHLLLTGDLTAWGKAAQFIELAHALSDWPSQSVTLVAGNHDGGPARWRRMLCGPLRRFCATSWPGTILDFGDAVLVPIDTTLARRAPLFWALGNVDAPQLGLLDALTHPGTAPNRCIVIAMHHGPQLHPLQLFEGLTNRNQINALLRRGPHVAICCGHDHRALDLGQVYTAASVAHHPDPLRLYEIRNRRLVPIYRTSEPGDYWQMLVTT
jgi:3',5'-cyclic AMP phosphodiesterase CpdA